MDLSLGLQNTHVVVTGGGGMIGSKTVLQFLAAGAKVSCFDVSRDAMGALNARVNQLENAGRARYAFEVVDITDEEACRNAFARASIRFSWIQCCVALASLDLSVLPHHDSIVRLPLEQWERTLKVNATGTFLTAKTWLSLVENERDHAQSSSLVMVGSESGTFGERGNPDYASAKSAVQGGLLQSLAVDAQKIHPRARVNVVAPGPVDTPRFREECSTNPGQFYRDAQATAAMAIPVSMNAVAKSILFLASEAWSGNIHGQILAVNSGKQGKLLWRRSECEVSH